MTDIRNFSLCIIRVHIMTDVNIIALLGTEEASGILKIVCVYIIYINCNTSLSSIMKEELIILLSIGGACFLLMFVLAYYLMYGFDCTNYTTKYNEKIYT